MTAAVAAWLAVVASYVWRRSRKALDAAMVTVIVAAVHLGLATAIGVLLLARGFDARLVAAYGVLGVLGWLVLLIVGMALRIVPFLTWMYRFSPRMGQSGLPTVAQLTVPALGWLSLALLALGTLGLAAAVAVGAPGGARVAAVAFAVGAAVTALQHGRLARMAW